AGLRERSQHLPITPVRARESRVGRCAPGQTLVEARSADARARRVAHARARSWAGLPRGCALGWAIAKIARTVPCEDHAVEQDRCRTGRGASGVPGLNEWLADPLERTARPVGSVTASPRFGDDKPGGSLIPQRNLPDSDTAPGASLQEPM